VQRVLALAAVVSMLAAFPAHAQLGLSAGIEYFEWKEDTNPITVRETGALFALGLDWTQQKDKGFLLGYRGRLYFGDVDYDGALLDSPATPVKGTTSYRGMSNEAQARWRFAGRRGGQSFDLLGSVGYDFWERKLSADQKEDYQVIFLRLGMEINPAGSKGWMFGAGIKYPLWVEENAHLTDLGFDQNPKLEPGSGLSAYGQVGYRFTRHLALIGYLDGYNFRESDSVAVTSGGGSPTYVLQPTSLQYNVGARLLYLF
jgi:hypothetical protein